MKLEGKSVLVTGATGGIGQAIARAVLRRGAVPWLAGRRAEVLGALADEIGGRSFAVDLADRGALAKWIEEIADVDVLVANAALPGSGRIESFSVEDLDRALDVNLRAPMLMARHLAPRMAKRGAGHIVFVNSLSGRSSAARTSLYSATKFGLRGFALALREDFRDSGVGVSSVYPGFISDAGMFADAGVELPAGVGTKTPEEVAAAVVDAIENDVAEIDVAPISVRAGVFLSTVAPGLGAALQRMAGATALADAVAEGQRDKR